MSEAGRLMVRSQFEEHSDHHLFRVKISYKGSTVSGTSRMSFVEALQNVFEKQKRSHTPERWNDLKPEWCLRFVPSSAV